MLAWIFGDCREGQIPRCLQRCKFDTPLLAAGSLICNECNGDTDKDDKWTEKISGMTIYKDFQLKKVLEQAGFHDVKIQKNDKGWMSVSTRK